MSVPQSGGLFIKGYRELIRKAASGSHHDVADPYCVVLPSNASILMAHPEVSFDRAFSRLKDAILGEAELSGGIRSRWRASKTREQLRSALGSYYPHARAGGDSRTGGGFTAGEEELSQASSRSSTTSTSSSAISTTSSSPQEVAAATQPDPALAPLLGKSGYLRSSIIYVLASASRGFMTSLNTTEVQGAEEMERALRRPAGRALITVCNHVAALDDPLVMATIIPPAYYSQPHNMRWTTCASDRCFKYGTLSSLFTAAKVLPIQRGGGLHQAGMRAAEERLAAGDWVHVFPEGTRGSGGAGAPLGPARRGVGRLVASCPEAPLVVPFVHSGMEAVMPRGCKLPRVGQQVKVLVGEPIPLDDLLASARAQHWTDDRLHAAIAERVGRRLSALKACLDGVHCTVADAEAEMRWRDAAAAACSSSGSAAGGGADDAGVHGTFPAPLLWDRQMFNREWQQLGGHGGGGEATSSSSWAPLFSSAGSSGGAEQAGAAAGARTGAGGAERVVAGHPWQQQGGAVGRQFADFAEERSGRISMMLMGATC